MDSIWVDSQVLAIPGHPSPLLLLVLAATHKVAQTSDDSKDGRIVQVTTESGLELKKTPFLSGMDRQIFMWQSAPGRFSSI